METDDENYHDLKRYHDYLREVSDSFVTQKLSLEVADVIDIDVLKTRINRNDAKYVWSFSEQQKLDRLSSMAKTLKPPLWPWNASKHSRQGKYNHSRMQFLLTRESQYKILHCPQCGVTALLVGMDQINSKVCIDCLQLNRKTEQTKKRFEEVWLKVKPSDEVLKKVGAGGNEHMQNGEQLPNLNPGEESLLALYQPVVTVQRNFLASKRFKQESLNFVHSAEKTWCKILPRKSLENRFIIIEKRFSKGTQKYMIADPETIREWFRYLFANHSTCIRRRKANC